MKYEIFKLKFTSPVRFGGDRYTYGLTKYSICPHADTLFSAISHEWIQLYGINSYQEFVQYAMQDEFQISDLLPYVNYQKRDYSYYIPRPMIQLEADYSEREIEPKNIKKKLKKIEYIAINEVDAYLNYLKKGGAFPLTEEKFGHSHEITRVYKHRLEDASPYPISSFIFHENAGLYFIIRMGEQFKHQFAEVIDSLGKSGIGGKKSSGYGKFELADDPHEIGFENGQPFGIYDSDERLLEKLIRTDCSYLSLSIIYPTEEDLNALTDSDTYSILDRRGFVYSATYAEQFVKRQNAYAFNRGSVFSRPLKGQILDLSIEGTHPVYRYGKCFFIGGFPHE